MLIAKLVQLIYQTSPEGREERDMYCATDPISGEMLSGWHPTILEVDYALEDLDVHWGLPLRTLVNEGYDVYPNGDDPCGTLEEPDSDTTSSSAIPCS